MRKLLDLLSSDDIKTLHVLKRAVSVNLAFKRDRYKKLLEKEELRLEEEVQRVQGSKQKWKQWAGMQDDSSDWDIFNKLSEQLQVMDKAVRTFRELYTRCKTELLRTHLKLDNPLGNPADRALVNKMRLSLLEKVKALTPFVNQSEVIDSVCEIVLCFLHEPTFLQNKFLNIMLTGAPGTGKTTLAEAIAQVLSAAGLFLDNDILEASRSDFIGQYLGETAPKTMSFLFRGLDKGVMFIDEAYALCPRDPKDNQPDAYGTEFASALVQFMTTYKGLYCIIAAGYKEEMNRDFLPCNEGLGRRMFYRFDLKDQTASGMIRIFQRYLMKLMGLTPPINTRQKLASEAYFTPRAWEYLTALTEMGLPAQGLPKEHPIAGLFKNQAGSMTNLAEGASTYLLSRRQKVLDSATPPRSGRDGHNYEVATLAQLGTNLPTLKLEDMRIIVRRRLRQTASVHVDDAVRHLDEVEKKLLPRFKIPTNKP